MQQRNADRTVQPRDLALAFVLEQGGAAGADGYIIFDSKHEPLAQGGFFS
jgi:hypothetical protein